MAPYYQVEDISNFSGRRRYEFYTGREEDFSYDEFFNTIRGDFRDNALNGVPGQSDQIKGGRGDDTITGGESLRYLQPNRVDYLRGQLGDDTLRSKGLAILEGGPGADTFVFSKEDGPHSVHLRDFSREEGDQIVLEGYDLSESELQAILEAERDDDWEPGIIRWGGPMNRDNMIDFTGVNGVETTPASELEVGDFILS